jgi:FixJ family two-component response regulator
VDDDASVRTAISSLVRSIGCDSLVFSSAAAFIDSGCESRSDCLITDIHMPGMSGLDLHDKLHAAGSTVPVIFITAFPEFKTREHALQRGAICFLVKPFNADVLIDCVERALQRGLS